MKRLKNCIESKIYEGCPIWFMRQAGRYLPEFRKIRKKNPNFIKLCLNKNLSSTISLQPLKRYDLDAAIIFSDILIIPHGLGQNVMFKKNFGPQLGILNIKKIINIDPNTFVKKIKPVYEAITKIRKNIDKNKSVIGFVGAPWTLLVYMINKESPKNNNNINKILNDKILIKELLNKLNEIICLHVDKQIEAGADIIQIFDSWAGLLNKKNLSEYCYIPNQKIVEHIKSKKVPAICFPRGIKKNYFDFCSIVKPNCISIDYSIDPLWAKNQLKNIPIQGGMDPKILLLNKDVVKRKVEEYLNIFNDYPYIFNLGHGILPNTNPEIIDYVIKIIRNRKK